MALNVKKTAMWSVVTCKLYEKLTGRNIVSPKNLTKTKKKEDEPEKAAKKEESKMSTSTRARSKNLFMLSATELAISSLRQFF